MILIKIAQIWLWRIYHRSCPKILGNSESQLNRPCLYCKIFENTELENIKGLYHAGKHRGTAHAFDGAADLKQASKSRGSRLYHLSTLIKTTPSNWSLKTTNFYITQILMSSSLTQTFSLNKVRIFVSHETKTPNTFCWEFLKISPLFIFFGL